MLLYFELEGNVLKLSLDLKIQIAINPGLLHLIFFQVVISTPKQEFTCIALQFTSDLFSLSNIIESH